MPYPFEPLEILEAADLNAALAARVRPRGEYDALTDYETNDLVFVDDTFYLALDASTGVTPGTDPAVWKAVGNGSGGGGGDVAWEDVTGKPSTFPPGGGAGGVLSGSYPNPGFAVDMATQAELDDAVSTLDSAIAGKADASHTHTSADISDFQSAARDAMEYATGAPVADLAALRAVAEADRQDKQVRLVESASGGVGALYRFDTGGAGSDDGDGTIAPDAGSGRWFKIAGAAASTGDASTLNGQNGAHYLDRANHTGTQAISTVTGLQTAIDGKANTSHTHAGEAITSGTVAAARLGAMTGADGTNAGASGAVPAPAATDNVKFLRGDGTWDTPSGAGTIAAALVSSSTPQSLPTNTVTALSFTTEERDDGGLFSSGQPTRLTAPTDGWYHASSVFTTVGGGNFNALIRKNGTDEITRSGGSIGDGQVFNLAASVYLLAGDYLEVVADVLAAVTTTETTGTAYFALAQATLGEAAASGGDVSGSASSTDNALTRFDGTTGKLLQNSGVTLDDNGVLTLPAASTPSAPGAGVSLYAKSDGKIYRRASGGSETELGAGGGGGGSAQTQRVVFQDAPALSSVRFTHGASSYDTTVESIAANIPAFVSALGSALSLSITLEGGRLTTMSDAFGGTVRGSLLLNMGASISLMGVSGSAVRAFQITNGDTGNYTLNGGAVFQLGVTEAQLQTNQRNLGGQLANVVVKGSSTIPTGKVFDFDAPSASGNYTVGGSAAFAPGDTTSAIQTKVQAVLAGALIAGTSTPGVAGGFSAAISSANAGRAAAQAGADGMIYLFGGDYSNGSIRRFNPANNTTTTLAATISNLLLYTTALGANGKIYLAGGHPYGSSAIREYDPATGTMATKQAVMPQPLDEPHSGCMVAVGSYIYAVGVPTTSGGASNKIVRYDPSNDTVSVLPQVLPSSRTYHACVAIGNKIYVLGGQDGTTAENKAIYVFDPVEQTVETRAGTLATEINSGTAEALDSKIYLFSRASSKEIVIYDTFSDSISTSSQTLPDQLIRPAAATKVNGVIYLVGGAENRHEIRSFTPSTPGALDLTITMPASAGNVATPAVTGTNATIAVNTPYAAASANFKSYFPLGATPSSPTATGTGASVSIEQDPASISPWAWVTT